MQISTDLFVYTRFIRYTLAIVKLGFTPYS